MIEQYERMGVNHPDRTRWGWCRELRNRMADYVEIALPEPAEDDVAQMRMLIEKVVEKG